MNNSNINTKQEYSLRVLKRQILSHVKVVRGVILGLILFVLTVFVIFIYGVISKSAIGTTVGLVRDFIFPSTTRIVSSNNKINILVMGKGGVNHDAPDLTDTMILVSVDINSNKVSMISIPRDIWINDLKDKINSAYMYGRAKGGSATGLILAKSTVEAVTGAQIDYGVVIDFGSFREIINAIGGIQIDVKNGFTDIQYPIEGRENDLCNGDKLYACRYETVTFNAGVQTMDGDTALKFVRSRHATGLEGSDIARETRQQLVISSIMKTVISKKVFMNLSIDQKLLQIAQNNIEMDLKPSEAATLLRYLSNSRENIKSYTIPDNLLYNPVDEYKYHNAIFTHAFVFIPNNSQSKNGNTEDWSDIQKWVKDTL